MRSQYPRYTMNFCNSTVIIEEKKDLKNEQRTLVGIFQRRWTSRWLQGKVLAITFFCHEGQIDWNSKETPPQCWVILKNKTGVWTDGSGVQSIGYSCRGPSWVPSTHAGWLTAASYSCSRESNNLFWPRQALHLTFVHIQLWVKINLLRRNKTMRN